MARVDRQTALYAGGLMGPFGTQIVAPMFPELADEFSTTTEQMGWSLTVYLIPFTLLMVVSGTIGERFGRGRVLRATFVTYAVASLLCAIAPNLTVFLVGRALQGVGNAFITPLLLAILADLNPTERLGRAVGVYSSSQALGMVLSPLFGGILADVDWRLAFALLAATATALLVILPVGAQRATSTLGSWIPPITRSVVLLGTAAFSAAFGAVGIGYLVAVLVRDTFALSATEAGLVLVCGAMAAFLTGPAGGALVDRLGAAPVALGGVGVSGSLVMTVGFLGSLWVLVVVWTIAGATSGLIFVAIQRMAADVIPGNRGGGLSAVLACRFAGHAASPALWPVVYAGSMATAFVGAGLATFGAFVGLGLLWAGGRADLQSLTR